MSYPCICFDFGSSVELSSSSNARPMIEENPYSEWYRYSKILTLKRHRHRPIYFAYYPHIRSMEYSCSKNHFWLTTKVDMKFMVAFI